jgi:hypothetical protein
MSLRQLQFNLNSTFGNFAPKRSGPTPIGRDKKMLEKPGNRAANIPTPES